AVLLIALALWLVFFNEPKKPELVTQPAAIGNVEKTVLASGTLEPFEQVNVGAQVSGQVTKLNVELGDEVKAGDLIAEIDSQKQKNDLATSQAALNNQKAQRATALASLAQAQSNFTRQQTLYQADAGSKADYESAVQQLKAAQASLDAANSQIQQATISVNTANVNLGYTRIVAPMNGTVIAIITKQGQTVNANQSAPTIVVLGQLDKMTVKSEISEADVIRIKPGQKVYFTTLGDPEKKYYARLRSVEPAPTDFTGETTTGNTSSAIYYYGLFDVDNPDGTLRPSMTAQVYIIQESANNVLTIPAAALGRKDRDGSYTVRVVGKDKAPQTVKVKVGINDGTNAQILSGLKAGQQVVIAQASGLSASSGGNPGGGGLAGGGARRPRGM
ncbi:MAG TPA: efflux RND transporter periplasmic adaptor subunit, partial [Devosia sp.]|nr:efflux RND transporter periplasmic adaptor subunit [Devosia sp.]